MGRHYAAEFKESAVKLVTEQGLSAREAASSLGIKHTTLLSWIKRHRRGEGASRARDDLRQQVKSMQAEIDRLRMERDILKKAAAYIAREERP
jgi:transposase